MDAESADMLAALRRQIQPHLMMAALTPTRISSGHPPPSTAQLNYSLPLPNYLIHVSKSPSYSKAHIQVIDYICISIFSISN